MNNKKEACRFTQSASQSNSKPTSIARDEKRNFLYGKKGLLLVISGPSGAGKGTICGEYLKKHAGECALSVSATTRAPRDGEKDGVNYYFLSMKEFEERISGDGFLEHAVFCENRYGTPKAPVMEMIESGKDVILEIEVQGAMQVRSHYPEGVFIFVLPPSKKALEERLRGRGTETDEVIAKRLERAQKEYSFVEKYNKTDHELFFPITCSYF